MLLLDEDRQECQHGGDREQRQDEVVGAHVPDQVRDGLSPQRGRQLSATHTH